MPYACLLFADDVDSFMRSAADTIAKGSAFEPHPIFHVPLIGSLHSYTAEEVATAGMRTRTDEVALSFHFGKWELCGSHLRATVDSAVAQELVGRLQVELPVGRPWASHYVTVGSVAAIDKERREEFLSAVQAAYPIDPQIEYNFKSHLEYNEHNVAPHKPPATRRPKKGPSRTKPQAARPAQPVRSLHRKWKRGADSMHVDATTTTTGPTGAAVQSAGIGKHRAKTAGTFTRRAAHARRGGPLAQR